MPVPYNAGQVRPLGPVLAHLWRVKRMARATDVDLATAMEEGRLTSPDWAAMVTRCRGCAWAEGCERWLQSYEDAARPVPSQCQNQARFAAIREGGEPLS